MLQFLNQTLYLNTGQVWTAEGMEMTVGKGGERKGIKIDVYG